jgi:hypothetical protein
MASTPTRILAKAYGARVSPFASTMTGAELLRCSWDSRHVEAPSWPRSSSLSWPFEEEMRLRYASPSRMYVRTSGRESAASRISVCHGDENGLGGKGKSNNVPRALGLF